jgi:hypothetical protein
MQPQIPDRRDPLEDLMNILKIAQAGYGIKTDYELGKLRDLTIRQEKVKTDKIEREHERRLHGYVNEEEFAKLHTKDVGPGTPGALMTYIKVPELDPDTKMRLKDADGNDILHDEPRWYIPEGNYTEEGKRIQNSAESIKLNQMRAAERGQLTPAMLMDTSIVHGYSTVPREDYRKGSLYHPEDGSSEPIWWISPSDYKAQQELLNYRTNKAKDDRMQMERALDDARKLIELGQNVEYNKLKIEELNNKLNSPENDLSKMTGKDWLGWKGARDRGIVEPTADDIRNFNPDNISVDMEQVRTKILDQKVDPLIVKLKKLDKILPGGIDGNGKMENYGDWRWFAAKTIPYDIGKTRLTEKEAQLKTTVDGIMADIRLMQAGTAVSAKEEAVIKQVLGMDLFSRESDLREGMRNVRDLARSRLATILGPLSPVSMERYKSQREAITLDDPIFKNAKIITDEITPLPEEPPKPKALVPTKFSPGATTEEKIDQMMQEGGRRPTYEPPKRSNPPTRTYKPPENSKPLTPQNPTNGYTKGASAKDIENVIKNLGELPRTK